MRAPSAPRLAGRSGHTCSPRRGDEGREARIESRPELFYEATMAKTQQNPKKRPPPISPAPAPKKKGKAGKKGKGKKSSPDSDSRRARERTPPESIVDPVSADETTGPGLAAQGRETKQGLRNMLKAIAPSEPQKDDGIVPGRVADAARNLFNPILTMPDGLVPTGLFPEGAVECMEIASRENMKDVTKPRYDEDVDAEGLDRESDQMIGLGVVGIGTCVKLLTQILQNQSQFAKRLDALEQPRAPETASNDGRPRSSEVSREHYGALTGELHGRNQLWNQCCDFFDSAPVIKEIPLVILDKDQVFARPAVSRYTRAARVGRWEKSGEESGTAGVREGRERLRGCRGDRLGDERGRARA